MLAASGIDDLARDHLEVALFLGVPAAHVAAIEPDHDGLSRFTSSSLSPRSARPASSPRSIRATSVSAATPGSSSATSRSEEHTSELQSRQYLVCRLLLDK